MSRYPVQDFIYKHFPWSMVFYARTRYPYPWRVLWAAWREARNYEPKDFLGYPNSRQSEFIGIIIDRCDDESLRYRCALGQCTVIWHPKLGLRGSYGIAGCPCDELADPRGAQPVLVQSG